MDLVVWPLSLTVLLLTNHVVFTLSQYHFPTLVVMKIGHLSYILNVLLLMCMGAESGDTAIC